MTNSIPNAHVLTDNEREYLTRCALIPRPARQCFLALAEIPVANDAAENSCNSETAAL